MTARSAPARSDGRELSYIEGWYAISEANRIFGFDGWSRETVETRCVLARENRGTFIAVYIAKVRISVQQQEPPLFARVTASGEGRGTSPGEVHDIALKAAETDATKRALATFGKPFGLELYRKDKSLFVEQFDSCRRRWRQAHPLNPASVFTPMIRPRYLGPRSITVGGTKTR